MCTDLIYTSWVNNNDLHPLAAVSQMYATSFAIKFSLLSLPIKQVNCDHILSLCLLYSLCLPAVLNWQLLLC